MLELWSGDEVTEVVRDGQTGKRGFDDKLSMSIEREKSRRNTVTFCELNFGQ